MAMDFQPLLPKVMDLLLDAVCVVDLEGRFVFVSAACEHIFGYTQAELIGRNMIDLVHPADRERTLETAEDIMSGRSRTHFENRYVRKDGKVVHIMWSARWSESDRLRLAVARDVTELRRAERMQNALYQISEAAHSAEGLFALYQHIHRIIDDLLPASNFFVALHDSSTNTLSFPYFVDEREQAPAPQLLVPDTPIAKIIDTGQPLLMTSGRTNATSNTESAAEDHYLGWLGVPLISQKGVMGALVVQSYSAEVCYTDEHKDLLHFVSTQVAAAIERKQTETRLFYLAHHDALTDLPNRILFNDRFDMALKRARRDGEHLTLLYLDLNGFKQVNDSFGHRAGDLLLCEVAQRLAQCVRESDTIGRVGGDEFTVLLTNTGGSACVDIIVEKIRAAINVPFEFNGKSLTISTSIGTAVYPEQGGEREQLYHHADASMYAAKERGD